MFTKKQNIEQIRHEIYLDIKNDFDNKLKEEKCRIISDALGKLNDLTNKIGCAVKVEVDNSKAITIIIGEIEHALANNFIKEAKRSLLEELNKI